MRAAWRAFRSDEPVISAAQLHRLNVAVMFVLFPLTVLTLPPFPLGSLGEQVWYVTLISHLALILSCLGALQAARVEVKQDEGSDERPGSAQEG